MAVITTAATWVTVVAVAVWAVVVLCLSVQVIGSAAMRSVAITTLPRMFAVFAAVLAELELPLLPTLDILLLWTIRLSLA
jgi:NAD/NADP transhydrogenase beta subunit